MTSKLCRGRALLAALPLLWLHFGPMSAQSVSANTPALTSGQRQIESTVEEILGASVEVSFLANRVLEIDLHGQKTAASVAGVITRLALDDVETDDVLLLSLRFKNGNLVGALELRDLTLPFALEFGEAESDSTFSENLTFESMTFENMTFEKKVVFSKVSWSGEAFIDRSDFLQGLTIKYSMLEPSGGDEFNKIHINKTLIERDLHLLRVEVNGELLLYDNTIVPAFRIEDTSVYDGTKLRDNDFADLMIHGGEFHEFIMINSNNTDRIELKDGVFAGWVLINQNNIADEVVVDGVVLAHPDFELAANTIGQELYFQPKNVAYVVENLGLMANTVGGVASIMIPIARADRTSVDPFNDFGWHALRVNLASSTFRGILTVGLASGEEGDAAATAPALTEKESGPQVIDKAETELVKYCYRNQQPYKVLTFDLSSATAKRFAWNLPFGDCSYHWSGSGFRYDQWLGTNQLDDTGGHEAGQDLLRWRGQISDRQPSALIFMSDYLRAQGRFTDSRNVLFDAKSMDYEPTSDCTGAFLTPESCSRQGLLYAFMWTSGFGVKPEYALGMLAGTWLLGLLVYAPYVWFMRWWQRDRPIIVIPRWLNALIGSANPRLAPPPPRGALVGPVHGKDAPGICPPRGFQQYHDGEPKDFKLWVFSLDATIPVVNLHAYDAFFPSVFLVRVLSFLQHIFGWWIVTSLLASLALL